MTKILSETLRLAIERETANRNLQARTTNFSIFLSLFVKYLLSLCVHQVSISLKTTSYNAAFKGYMIPIIHD